MINMRPAVALVTVMAALAATAEGQLRRPQPTPRAWTFDGHAGVAIPARDLADVTNAGPTVGVQLSYLLSPRVSFGLNGDVDWLGGQSLGGAVSTPDMTVWRYSAGLQVNVLSPSAPTWSVLAHVGLGATSFTSDDFTVSGGSPESFGHTYLSPAGGLRVAYQASPRLRVFTRANANWALMNRGDTGRLVALAPTRLRTFTSGWSLPITAGVNLRI